MNNLLARLKECGRSRDLDLGNRLHLEATTSGLSSSPHVLNALITMYSRCGSLSEARKLFDHTSRRDVVTWNSLIQGYVLNGEYDESLNIFQAMKDGDCPPDARTYAAALLACSRLASNEDQDTSGEKWISKGLAIHQEAVNNHRCNHVVETTVVDMYSTCGRMVEARVLFDNMLYRDTVTWNALIQGYVENGHFETALEVFDEMDNQACLPSERTFVGALTSVANLGARDTSPNSSHLLDKGRYLHSKAVAAGCSRQFHVQSALVNMYSKCGSMPEARRVFDRMRVRDVVVYTSLLQGYLDVGDPELVLELFLHMSCSPDARAYSVAVAACVRLKWLETGEMIYSQALATFSVDIIVENTMIGLYSECSRIEKARVVFDTMKNRSIVSWNSLLQGYVGSSQMETAVEMFLQLLREGECLADERSYVVALTACAGLAERDRNVAKHLWLEIGRDVHARALAMQYGNSYENLYVGNALISMYGQGGEMVRARVVFDSMAVTDVVSWNALLEGYVQSGETELAWSLFSSFPCQPTPRTYLTILQASVTLEPHAARKYLKSVHLQALRNDSCDVFVENSLIDFYGKCKCLREALLVFETMKDKNVVSWNSLMMVCVENGENSLVLQLRDEMEFPKTAATFVAEVMACGSLMALELGKAVHGEVRECGLEQELGAWLVELYGKCASMELAEQVFQSLRVKDTKEWNALVCGYSLKGDVKEVSRKLEKMREQGVQPDEITWTHVLSACSHSGCVDNGIQHFVGGKRDMIHSQCMIDLLARASI